MKKLFAYLVLFSNLACHQESSPETLNISQPVLIEGESWSFKGSENLIFVPENRNEPKSRKIALHYFSFPAIHKSNLPPVVFLGAGPGEPYSIESFYNGKRAEAWRFELNQVIKKRDVILINQRGNPEAPGLSISDFEYKWSNGGSLDKPFDLGLMNQNRRKAYQKHIKAFTERGIDLKGYDILHFVDDIDAIRKKIGAEKIALIGNSFASQWALGYIRRYPEHVDRALFSGLEPLDNNYDDPEGIWNVLEQIEAYARKDEKIKNDLPKDGLLKAFKTIIRRLEKQPESVQIEIDGKLETMEVGADDLRYGLMNRNSGSYLGEIESWPKYITEMYNGDFRFLALNSIGRIYNSSSIMINPLFNNSLGISNEREKLINQRPAKRWLGDINAHYTSTRDICPSPRVNDIFRLQPKTEIPVLIIQGDMDLSTPFENTESLIDSLENGHLIRVNRGFHNAKRALIFADSTLMKSVYEFMNLDFTKTNFIEFKKTLPKSYEMPEFDFWSVNGKVLYDQ